ncbi:hypothetical protein HDU96_007167 [Phlyctochytrium bullatum]|nr:hypothetical protein HDU96_007167 [Phlyctochytrium bullatum]
MSNRDDDSDDDIPQLSADTLLALQSFLTEKQENEERFERLRSAAHEEADAAAERAKAELDVKDFGEDWQCKEDWRVADGSFYRRDRGEEFKAMEEKPRNPLSGY